MSVEDRVLLVGHALDEVPVVRDDDERARPRVEQVFERGEHVGVEVVRRLVEDQHVRLLEEDEQQLQSALLTTREVLHRGRELGALEAEPFEQLARRELLGLGSRTEDVARAQPRDHDAHRVCEVRLEVVDALGERRHLDGLAALDTSGRGLDRARDQPQERRLARAVHAQDAGALAGREAPLDVAQHGRIGGVVGHRDVEQIHDVLAEARDRE